MKRSHAGFSLMELLFGMSIFMLFLGGVFGLFVRGYQAVNFLQTRQSLHGEFLRIKSILQADFGATHVRSIGVESRTVLLGADTVHRDQACCLILANWSDRDSYSPDMGIPLWDRYAVYRTSLTEGTLERVALAPDLPTPYRIRPLEDFATIAEEEVVNRTLLSSDIRSFACQVDRAMQEVVLTFELESDGVKRGLDENKVKERFKAQLQWLPSNTVPRL